MGVTNPYRVTLNINVKNAGWSERYFTAQTNASDALRVATTIAKYRTAFFGAGVSLVYAHASTTDSKKDAISCDLNFPLGPHKSVALGVEAPNDPFSAVQQRFETAGGQWVNRMYRGCPDNYIEGQVLNVPDYFRPLPIGQAPYDPDGNANLANISKSFWTYLMLNSPHSRKETGNVYNQIFYTRVMPIRISRHQTGRPFGLFRGRAPANLIT